MILACHDFAAALGGLNVRHMAAVRDVAFWLGAANVRVCARGSA